MASRQPSILERIRRCINGPTGGPTELDHLTPGDYLVLGRMVEAIWSRRRRDIWLDRHLRPWHGRVWAAVLISVYEWMVILSPRRRRVDWDAMSPGYAMLRGTAMRAIRARGIQAAIGRVRDLRRQLVAALVAGLAAVARRVDPVPAFTPLERLSVSAVALRAP